MTARADDVAKSLPLNTCTSDCIDSKFKVSAGDIRAKFPEITVSDKIAAVDYMDMKVERPITIKFVPQVTAEHVLTVKRLSCKRDDKTLDCVASPETRYFLSDSNDSFYAENISMDKALEVARLYSSGKTVDTNGKQMNFKTRLLRDIDIWGFSSGAMMLNMISDGCTSRYGVAIKGQGDSAILEMGLFEIACN